MVNKKQINGVFRAGYDVYKTTQYEKFTVLQGNRRINELHRQRLMKAMKARYLVSICYVNDRFEIIDGQHRFSICEELGLPFYFIIIPGYSLEEVQILNARTKNWTAVDLLDSFCDRGKKEYQRARDFMECYGLSFSPAIRLLTHNRVISKSSESFSSGTLCIHEDDYNRALKIADRIREIADLVSFARQDNFIAAYSDAFDQKEFKPAEFLKKAVAYPSKLIRQSTTDQYLAMIESLYNYYRDKGQHVRLRK